MKKYALTLAALTVMLCAGQVNAEPSMPASTAPAAAIAPAAPAVAAVPAKMAMPVATPVAAPATAAPAMSAQNMKMKDCAAQYHAKGIAKSQYKTFMSQCLKATPAVAAVPAMPASAAAVTPVSAPGTMTPQARMKSCNDNATTQKLMGGARTVFMKSCLSAK